MKIFTHTIDAHKDFELDYGVKRTITYSVAFPGHDNIKGLVVYIAGFGEDAGTYRTTFQEHICETYEMACLCVDYHCFFSRPHNGAAITFKKETLTLLQSITGLHRHGGNVNELLSKAAELRTDKTAPLIVPGTLEPSKGEYQNFGILPALDHIFALYDVFGRYTQIPKTILAIGSSYGGYIANLVSKFAPNTLNAVFDNSSWAKPNLKYIKGEDLGICEFEGYLNPNVTIFLNVLSPWTHKANMPNTFDAGRKEIRSFPWAHIEIMAKAGKQKTIYRFAHAHEDVISDTGEKIELARGLQSLDFDAQIKIFTPGDIDGRYIKHMEHGMGMSMRLFFANSYQQVQPLIVSHDQNLDFDFPHTLSFPCEGRTYTITYSGKSQPECSVQEA